jgi:hypothetical protein
MSHQPHRNGRFGGIVRRTFSCVTRLTIRRIRTV